MKREARFPLKKATSSVRPLAPDPKKDPTLDFETQMLLESIGLVGVIGIDEAGRGAIAGPVAVGAHVVLRGTTQFPAGLRDSKLLSEARREWLFPSVESWGVGSVGFGAAHDIDARGISRVLAEAGREALLGIHTQGIDVKRCLIIVDGSHDWLSPALQHPLNVVTRVGADRLHASVAAASMRAKVLRDRLMLHAHDTEPGYAWNSNKGYGAKAHYEGIAVHGLSPLHRATWIAPSALEPRVN